jgi:hypothetical protein
MPAVAAEVVILSSRVLETENFIRRVCNLAPAPFDCENWVWQNGSRFHVRSRSFAYGMLERR